MTAPLYAFRIYFIDRVKWQGGIKELSVLHVRTAPFALHHSPAKRTRKRDFSEVTAPADDEVENSDCEYGWAEEDTQLAAEGLVDESCLMDDEPSRPRRNPADFKPAHAYANDIEKVM